MGRHFRTPEDAQPASPAPVFDDSGSPTAGSPADPAPAAATQQTDPFAYDEGAWRQDEGETVHTDAATGQGAHATGRLFDVPSPDDEPVARPASPDVFMSQVEATASSIDADERRQIADVDAALQNPNFTTVFAPIDTTKDSVRAEGVDPVILMEHLTKIYDAQPDKPALNDVNLEIYPGEFVFLVGHSGSGKSTMLNTIIREIKPTSGRILVAGQDLTKIKNRKVPYLRRQIGTVFQDYKLLPNKTVYENVAFALQCIGKPRGVIRTQVPEVLRLVGLGDRMDSFPDELSGGEQQRVSVARAMVNRPPLLVCDEPTGNLDPAISLGIMKLLDRINRTGTTVIVATHDREMVDSMHRRVVGLEGGQVVRDQERGGYGNYGTL